MENNKKSNIVPAIGRETFVCLIVIMAVFIVLGSVMGLSNMLSTMFNTAHDLILNTIWYLMGVLVLSGALVSLMSEFGIIALLNKVLSPLMKPFYGLPGAAALGVITCYMGDSPAIVSLGKDKGFIKYFTPRQRAVLSNLGATFAMGLVVTSFMLGVAPESDIVVAVLVGNIAAVCASIISVRFMSVYTKRYYGEAGDKLIRVEGDTDGGLDIFTQRRIREGSGFNRVMSALLDGGKSGVEIGLSIIPGNVIICTFVMMFTRGAGPDGTFTGAAMEGIGLLPAIADKLHFILDPLFGFSSPQAIAFPCTAVGSVGASLGMIPGFWSSGLIGAKDLAVFTAMGMTFSGYLSVHVAMMDALDCRELAGKAVLTHTVAGLSAGIIANWLFKLITMVL